MFMNEDSIKKKSLLYLKGEEYFIYDGHKFYFKDITHFFNTSNLHITNSVLEGKTQILSLIFNEKDKVQLSIDSAKRNKEKYKSVYKLIQRIQNDRRSLLLDKYSKNKCISFGYKSNFLATEPPASISIKNGQLFYNGKASFQVDNITIDAEETYIKLKGEGKEQVLGINKCSDALLLLELIKQDVPHTVIPDKKALLTMKMKWFLNIILILIAINGWGEYNFFGVPFLDKLSLLIGILVAAKIVTYPAFWLVSKLGAKRLKRIVDTEREAFQEM